MLVGFGLVVSYCLEQREYEYKQTSINMDSTHIVSLKYIVIIIEILQDHIV